MQKLEQDKECLDSLTCPSFNCYFTDQLAGVRTQNDDAFSASLNDDPDFEFAAFRAEPFSDDAVFPLFNRLAASSAALLRRRRSENENDPPAAAAESSESEDGELEGVPAGTYCLWTPNSPQASPGKCKKSNSTGSSSARKWKLLDLLRRSNSEGKESFAFLTEKKKANERWSIEVAGKAKGKGFAGGGKKAAVSAHEALYVRNRELKRIDNKKSFLPYKPDLVGFCTRRLGKAFPSF
ncbi:hypothetical protein Fmac_029087 [Flemingia macrophylla]|uniref:Uncharacterized protein n=1 Tax=Flemingia macrophylla TaxID=520843 RepID=A0ABD1L9V5_9FABA